MLPEKQRKKILIVCPFGIMPLCDEVGKIYKLEPKERVTTFYIKKDCIITSKKTKSWPKKLRKKLKNMKEET
jgi:hypothetical protein